MITAPVFAVLAALVALHTLPATVSATCPATCNKSYMKTARECATSAEIFNACSVNYCETGPGFECGTRVAGPLTPGDCPNTFRRTKERADKDCMLFNARRDDCTVELATTENGGGKTIAGWSCMEGAKEVPMEPCSASFSHLDLSFDLDNLQKQTAVVGGGPFDSVCFKVCDTHTNPLPVQVDSGGFSCGDAGTLIGPSSIELPANQETCFGMTFNFSGACSGGTAPTPSECKLEYITELGTIEIDVDTDIFDICG